jgi:hypothetical protein
VFFTHSEEEEEEETSMSLVKQGDSGFLLKRVRDGITDE